MTMIKLQYLQTMVYMCLVCVHVPYGDQFLHVLKFDISAVLCKIAKFMLVIFNYTNKLICIADLV